METIYTVNSNKKETIENNEVKFVYIGKPFIDSDTKVVEYEQLCEYEGEPHFNINCNPYNFMASYSNYNHINISEDESVAVINAIFRADINKYFIYTSKITETIETGKEEAEKELEELLRDFNATMIKSNSRLKAYCDIHNLDYETTDCIELSNIVFLDDDYDIVDGKLVVENGWNEHNNEPQIVCNPLDEFKLNHAVTNKLCYHMLE